MGVVEAVQAVEDVEILEVVEAAEAVEVVEVVEVVEAAETVEAVEVVQVVPVEDLVDAVHRSLLLQTLLFGGADRQCRKIGAAELFHAQVPCDAMRVAGNFTKAAYQHRMQMQLPVHRSNHPVEVAVMLLVPVHHGALLGVHCLAIPSITN